MEKTVKNILVAGGAGFIGSHLCAELIKQGNNVVAVDSFFTGSRENIESLIDSSKGRFSIIEHDITEPCDFTTKNGKPFDEIYNLACAASPPHYQKNPIGTLDANYLGMKNLLELATKHKARILQASTSEIYGDPKVHPQSEDYFGNVNINGPRACYDEGKRIAETLCGAYHEVYGTDIRIVRIFNTYGPLMQHDDGRVVSNFICQALSGKPITIYGDGTQTRSFCYIDDMIDGLIRMMENNKEITRPINLGNPEEYKVKDLAKIIIQKTGSGSPIIRNPLPQDDPAQRRPDIGRAKELLGWQPKTSLDKGLDKTIKYFSEHKSNWVDKHKSQTTDGRTRQ
jgi:UDP-glucuronate decarboxylase